MTNATPWTSRARQRDRRAASRRRPWPSHAPFSRRPPDAPARTAGLAASRPGARRKAPAGARTSRRQPLAAVCVFKLIVVEGVGSGTSRQGLPIAVSSATVEAPALATTSCAVAMRSGMIAEEGRDMRGDLGVGVSLAKRRQILLAGLLHHREPPRACRRASAASAGGRASEKKRAPWLPPKTSSSRREEASGAA